LASFAVLALVLAGMQGDEIRPAILQVTSDRQVVAVQAPRTLSDANAPLFTVGDTLNVFDRSIGSSRIVTITDRRRIEEGSRACGDGLAANEWVYQLDGASDLEFGRDDWYRYIALPRRMPVQLSRPDAGSEVAYRAFRTTYRRELDAAYAKRRPRLPSYIPEADYRRTLYGESGYGTLTAESLIAFIGPKGQKLYFVSGNLNDDLNDYTGTHTRITWILNANGQVLFRESGGHFALVVTDADGDGIQEIMTATGLVRWDGKRWVLPPPSDDIISC